MHITDAVALNVADSPGVCGRVLLFETWRAGFLAFTEVLGTTSSSRSGLARLETPVFQAFNDIRRIELVGVKSASLAIDGWSKGAAGADAYVGAVITFVTDKFELR
jgi:hypothetical protein